MAQRSISVRTLREVFRLSWLEKRSLREVAQSCGLHHSTVSKYLKQAQSLELDWAKTSGVDDAVLEELILGCSKVGDPLQKPEVMPDFSWVHQERKKSKHVTLKLIWEEYRSVHPDGYGYTQFCHHYRKWRATLEVSMRQTHRAGEKGFVDYAGETIDIVDAKTGEVRKAQLFLMVLGASNYTYAEATWDQTLPNWTASHVRAFDYFGGVPNILVPDNLKSGVTKACRYEPELNPTYHDLALHYNCVIIPARGYKPKDKAKAEVGVLIAERWIIARLRNQTFFSLAELNQAIWNLLEQYNEKSFQKLPGSRNSAFEELEKPALKALPKDAYIFAEWKKAGVNIDYHIELEGHYYSVPYRLVRKSVQVRFTATTVEIFYENKRVASHLRSYHRGQPSTLTEHMPKSHQKHLEWTPSKMIAWAEKTGPFCKQFAQELLKRRAHPEQGYRSILGIMRLGRRYTPERLEKACQRACTIGGYSYRSIDNILKKGLDRVPLNPEEAQQEEIVFHEHVRGPQYYQEQDDDQSQIGIGQGKDQSETKG